MERLGAQKTDRGKYGVILFDLDNLKKINDFRGHDKGDNLIIGAANCIQRAFGGIGKCYRIGGDEFVVIIRNFSQSNVDSCFKRFDLEREIFAKDGELEVEASYGYAFDSDGSRTDVYELFRSADDAMYEMKARKKAEVKQYADKNG